MCLAIPARVVEIQEPDQALVEVGGIRNLVSLALIDGVSVGDYVIVHVGHAIARLDVDEAEKTLALFRQIAETIGVEADALH